MKCDFKVKIVIEVSWNESMAIVYQRDKAASSKQLGNKKARKFQLQNSYWKTLGYGKKAFNYPQNQVATPEKRGGKY